MTDRKGFTLIEVLIYSALLAIFFGGSLFFLNSMLDSSGSISEKIELLATQEFIERKMEWAVSQSKEIVTPLPGATGNNLTLVLNDDSQVIFSLSDNVLYMSRGAGGAYALNNERVKINGFTVLTLNTVSVYPQLKVDINFESTGSRKFVSSSSQFYVFKR